MKQSGLLDAIKTFENADVRGAAKDMMQWAADRCEELVVEHYVPFDTGELHDSVFTEVYDDHFIIGASAKHAVFNEYGSYTTPIGAPDSPIEAKKKGYRPFLRPALYQVRREMPDVFGQKLQTLMTG